MLLWRRRTYWFFVSSLRIHFNVCTCQNHRIKLGPAYLTGSDGREQPPQGFVAAVHLARPCSCVKHHDQSPLNHFCPGLHGRPPVLMATLDMFPSLHHGWGRSADFQVMLPAVAHLAGVLQLSHGVSTRCDPVQVQCLAFPYLLSAYICTRLEQAHNTVMCSNLVYLQYEYACELHLLDNCQESACWPVMHAFWACADHSWGDTPQHICVLQQEPACAAASKVDSSPAQATVQPDKE